MDLRTYFQFFWVPAVTAAVLLCLAAVQGSLTTRSQLVFGGWFLSALAMQYFAPGASAGWVAGLTLQTVLAVALLLKQQLDARR